MGSRLLVVALIAAAALVTAASAQAAPPANDNFAAAQGITGESGTVGGTNAEATKEPGEPAHAGNAGGRSVWYRWTAPFTGNAVFETCGAEFDTLLAVYTGASVASVALIGANDDECGNASRVVVSVAAGIDYSIAVDGFDAESGPFTLRWSRLLPPPNDAFAAAITLTGAIGTTTGTSLGATREAGEPVHGPDSGGHSVWYSWTAPLTGNAVIETCGSEFDTLLAVYTGDVLTALSRVAEDDDRCGVSSRVLFRAQAGTTYRIAIDGSVAIAEVRSRGGLTLSWAVARPPRNDRFVAARRIAGRRGAVPGTNLGAAKEAREPAHAGNRGGDSVWYRWRAPRTGRVFFQTCGSSMDTLLAVYRGSRLARLRRIAADDDDCPDDLASIVLFTPRRGAVYRIARDRLH